MSNRRYHVSGRREVVTHATIMGVDVATTTTIIAIRTISAPSKPKAQAAFLALYPSYQIDGVDLG